MAFYSYVSYGAYSVNYSSFLRPKDFSSRFDAFCSSLFRLAVFYAN